MNRSNFKSIKGRGGFSPPIIVITISIIFLFCALIACVEKRELPGRDTQSDPDEDVPADMTEDVEDVEMEQVPGCGNGTVEGDEECDDGANGDDTDGCRDDCRFSCHDDGECTDGDRCNGEEVCNTDSHTCEPGTQAEDGTVCVEEPRSICIDGSCLESQCGDGFVDTGAGESCEPPNEGSCNENCRLICESDLDCPDDSEICNGEEYCDTGANECAHRNAPPDGTECQSDPRMICLAQTCQESVCGDEYVDGVEGEDCDDGNTLEGDGCENDCTFSCRAATQAVDCNDDQDCTDDVCDEADHTCSNPVSSASTVCRPSSGQCDVEELCDGTNTDCPVDAFAPAGTSCNDFNACTDPDECDGNGLCVGLGMIDVSAGENHTCGLTHSGGAMCWGDNQFGQLGDGTTFARRTPVDVSGLTSGVAAVIAGGAPYSGDTRNHSCGLTTAGGAKCWGRNASGQLGDGTTTDRRTPVDVSGLSSGVESISVGGFHTCAVLTTGALKCWGDSYAGQIGDGFYADRTAPVDVVGLSSGVAAVSAGRNHTCALMDTGGVKCWGDNRRGSLGDGTTTDSPVPVDVIGLPSAATAISIGGGHSCALLDTGAIVCWGSNRSGQLGDGTTTESSTPVNVSGLTSGATAVDAGENHTCAILDTGLLMCWGDNETGQLGDGTTTDSAVPLNVSGLALGVSVVSAGGHHTCAIASHGGVMCWGQNDRGQLGDDTMTDRLTPVDVQCN